MKIWVIRLIWVVTALVVGAVQENWKIDINYILDLHVHVPNYEQLPVAERAAALKANHGYMPYDYYFNHTNNTWILALGISQLKALKWALTVVFVAVFLFFNWRILKTFPEANPLLRTFAYAYIIAFGISFMVYLVGKAVGLGDTTYAVAREVVGALQSIVPSMLVIPVVLFQGKME